MDIERLARCIDSCERLTQMLSENRADIRSCVGERIAQTYEEAICEVNVSVQKTIRDLHMLLDANCI